MAVSTAGVSGCVSSPALEAFVAKVSEVESEFTRRFSELQAEFRQRISALRTEYCVMNSAPGRGSGSDATVQGTMEKEQWSVVGSAGGRRRRVLKARRRLQEPGVVTANAFSVLEEEGEAEERREGVDGRTLPQGNVIVFGDSQIRHLDSAFCSRDSKRRSRVCLPGAGIGRVTARIDTCLEENGNKPIVFLSAGGNDLGKVRSEELFGKFRLALEKIRSEVLVCGTLQRRGGDAKRVSRAIAV